MELKHDLKKVLSPRRFLAKELRQLQQRNFNDDPSTINEGKRGLLLPKSKEENQQSNIHKTKEIKPQIKEEKHQIGKPTLGEHLLKPEHQQERINPELMKKKKT